MSPQGYKVRVRLLSKEDGGGFIAWMHTAKKKMGRPVPKPKRSAA
jgi:hypothetical protein